MRCSAMALAVLAAPLFAVSLFAGDDGPPNFTGTWQLDAAKSPEAEGQSLTFTIKDDAGGIHFASVTHEKDGKEITRSFTCKAGGNTCDFDDGGHKCKVSVWYDGTALVILKTDGPKEDSVSQWKLQLSPDKSLLNAELSRIEPSDKPETLVFDKKPS